MQACTLQTIQQEYSYEIAISLEQMGKGVRFCSYFSRAFMVVLYG